MMKGVTVRPRAATATAAFQLAAVRETDFLLWAPSGQAAPTLVIGPYTAGGGFDVATCRTFVSRPAAHALGSFRRRSAGCRTASMATGFQVTDHATSDGGSILVTDPMAFAVDRANPAPPPRTKRRPDHRRAGRRGADTERAFEPQRRGRGRSVGRRGPLPGRPALEQPDGRLRVADPLGQVRAGAGEQPPAGGRGDVSGRARADLAQRRFTALRRRPSRSRTASISSSWASTRWSSSRRQTARSSSSGATERPTTSRPTSTWATARGSCGQRRPRRFGELIVACHQHQDPLHPGRGHGLCGRAPVPGRRPGRFLPRQLSVRRAALELPRPRSDDLRPDDRCRAADFRAPVLHARLRRSLADLLPRRRGPAGRRRGHRRLELHRRDTAPPRAPPGAASEGRTTSSGSSARSWIATRPTSWWPLGVPTRPGTRPSNATSASSASGSFPTAATWAAPSRSCSIAASAASATARRSSTTSARTTSRTMNSAIAFTAGSMTGASS